LKSIIGVGVGIVWSLRLLIILIIEKFLGSFFGSLKWHCVLHFYDEINLLVFRAYEAVL